METHHKWAKRGEKNERNAKLYSSPRQSKKEAHLSEHNRPAHSTDRIQAQEEAHQCEGGN
jgi:hypothetical protein